MASLNEIYIPIEKLEKVVEVLKKKSEKGIKLTIATSEKVDNYGQSVSCYVSQTKDDREAKKERFYLGNGKTFWTDGKIEVTPSKDQKPEKAKAEPTDDPF